MTEAQLYKQAGLIIQISMGRVAGNRRGRPRTGSAVWQADEDPLAYWSGVEAIVELAKRFRRGRKGLPE